MSEFIILWAAIQQAWNGQLWVGATLIIFVVAIALIFAGMVGHLARLLLGPAPFEPIKFTPRQAWGLLPFGVLVLIIILFGIMLPGWPVTFPQMLENSVRIVTRGVTN